MVKEIVLPEGKRYFTLEELEVLGLTRYKIEKLIHSGQLNRLKDKTYERAKYDVLYDNMKTGKDRLNAFMPAKIGLDARGMDRSLVHYVIPEKTDSLQLVQIGVQTTLLYDAGLVSHDYELVHFLFAGKGDATVGKQRFGVSAGQIMYFPKGVKFYFEHDDDDPAQYIWVGFCGEWAKRLIDGIGLSETNLVADIADVPAVKSLAEQLVKAIAEDSSYIGVMPFFWQIIQELMKVQGYVPLSKKRPEASTESRVDSRIADIIRHIERDYSQNIIVNDLADDLSVSRAWLSRKFKEMTGKTIKEYVTEVRLSHAKDLLSRTDQPVSEIAAECGYPNPLFFSRIFKQKTGQSPSDWRKMLR